VEQNGQTTTTQYVVDAQQPYAQVVEELDTNGTVTAKYVYGHDLLKVSRGGEYYYFSDGLGSVRLVVATADGGVRNRYSYEAYGTLLAGVEDREENTPNEYLFTGERVDTNTGLVYLRARYYDPATGRFNQLDSYQGTHHEPLTLHRYLYSHANPVTLTDPSGHMTLGEISIGRVIGVTVGAILADAVIRVLIGPIVGDPIYTRPSYHRYGKSRLWPDISQELRRTMQQVERVWQRHPAAHDDIREAITSLHPENIRTGIGSWDIFDLHGDTSAWIAPDLAGRDRMVYIDGQVFHSHAVNYVLYGRACKLAGVDRGLMAARIHQFKSLIYQGESENEAISWAVAGYEGWPDTASTPVNPQGDSVILEEANQRE